MMYDNRKFHNLTYRDYINAHNIHRKMICKKWSTNKPCHLNTEKSIKNNAQDIIKEPEKSNRSRIDEKREHSCGLYVYKKWWFRSAVSISVNGKLISGIPIFAENDTLRVINDNSSYFIPIEKIDFIRTSDGLKT